MKTFQAANGQWEIKDDNDVLDRLGNIDTEAPNWTYTVLDDERKPVVVTVDVSSTRPNLDSLANLYIKAQGSKRPEDAAAYLRHKTRVLAMFERRDVDGHRYE